MKPERALKKFQNINLYWLQALKKYTEEQLKIKTPASDWTLGQVYVHLVVINEIILEQIENCVNGKGEHYTSSNTFPAKVIFFFNRLPPLKYRIPKVIHHVPVQAGTKAEIIEKFNSVSKRTEMLLPQIKAADPFQKTGHPTLGMMNAADWYQFISIHMKHHLRQKKRLEAFILAGK